MADKQRSGVFVTRELVGVVGVFLCSEGGVNGRAAAWNMDGGWVAQ
ncbi:hypothetical protein ACVGWG_00865 [Enterobacter asburiae]